MEHVVSGLLSIWVTVLTNIMAFFTGDFWKGLEVPSLYTHDAGNTHSAGLGISESKNVFKPFLGSVEKGSAPHNPFMQWFPGLENVTEAFLLIGAFICIVLFLINILLVFLPDGMSQNAEEPGKIVIRFIAALILTAFAFTAIATITTPIAESFNIVASESITKTGFETEFDIEDEDEDKEEDTAKNLKDAAETGKSLDMDYSSRNNHNKTAEDEKIVSAWSVHIDSDSSGWMEDVAQALLVAILQTACALGFIRLALELVERYITLCFLYFCAPLATSTLASKGTTTVFVNYMKMIFSEMIVIMLNFIFMFAFIYAWNHPGNYVNGEWGHFSTWGHYMLFMCLLIAWTKLGTRLDELLNTLGFTAARTGAGMMGSIIAAAGSTMMAAGAAVGAAKAIPQRGMRAGKNAAAGAGASSAKDALAKGGAMGLAGRAIASKTGVGQTKTAAERAMATAGKSGKPVTGAAAIDAANMDGINTSGASAAHSNIDASSVNLAGKDGIATSYQQKGKLGDNVAKLQSGNFEAPVTSKNLNSDYVKEAAKPTNLGSGYSINSTAQGPATGITPAKHNGEDGFVVNNGIYKGFTGQQVTDQATGQSYTFVRGNIESADIKRENYRDGIIN